MLDNLCEAVFSFDTSNLTYFNRLGKKILYQCIEEKADMVPNGVLLETLQSYFKQSKSILNVQNDL